MPQHVQAKCYGMTDLFYGPFVPDARKERGRALREAKCKVICFQCPIRKPCLTEAMRSGEELGVWGGMSEGERLRFREFLQGRRFRNFDNALKAFYEDEEARYEVTVSGVAG